MAKQKDKAEKKKKKGNTGTLVFLMVTSLILIAFMRTGFVFFVVAMLPSIIAYYVDTHRPRTTFHTVFACNLSGFLPFMMKIIEQGPQARGYTTELMSELMNWLIIYASAGFGWLLVSTTPLFAQLLISMFHRGQIARFEMMQHRIMKEWGQEVSHFGKDHSSGE